MKGDPMSKPLLFANDKQVDDEDESQEITFEKADMRIRATVSAPIESSKDLLEKAKLLQDLLKENSVFADRRDYDLATQVHEYLLASIPRLTQMKSY